MKKIISNARLMLGEQKAKLEQLILDLENRSQLFEQKLSSADVEIKKYKELSYLYETKLQLLNTEIREVKRKAITEAKSIIEQASSTIENTVREIKTQQANRDAIREGKKQLTKLEEEIDVMEKDINETIESQTNTPLVFNLNDTVVLKSGGQSGTVLTLPDKNGNLQVAFNSIKAKIHSSNIKTVSKKETMKLSVTTSFLTDKKVSTEVDLRGLYGDEAIAIVDKFLDDAMLAGLHRIDIIHGHGTGVLRKRIQSFLVNDSRVKSQRFGEQGEGGSGITIVDLA